MFCRCLQIRRRDGSEGVYGVVDKPDFAVIVALQDGRAQLVEQYRYPVGGRYWEFPQGSWEGAALDASELARRELREETGLSAESLRPVGRLFTAYGYSSQAYTVFLATGLARGESDLEPEEQGLIARDFPLPAIGEMIRDGRIRDATTVAAYGLLSLLGLLPA